MSRKPRVVFAGGIYHVVNRGNDKRVVFPQDADYERFVELLQEGRAQAPIALIAYCLMPTHFHLMLRPADERALSGYMHWVTGSYASELRLRTKTRGHGHVFQRRFWASCLHDEAGVLTVLRYIEANPVRARLVHHAERWQWSSLRDRLRDKPRVVDPCPVVLPAEWRNWVNLGQDEFLLEMVRQNLAKTR